MTCGRSSSTVRRRVVAVRRRFGFRTRLTRVGRRLATHAGCRSGGRWPTVLGWVMRNRCSIGSPRCGPNSETARGARGCLFDKSHIDRAAPRHANRSTLIGDYAAPAVEVGQPTEPFRSGGVLLVRGRNLGTLIGRADRGCERVAQRVADRPRARDDQRRWATNDNGPTVAVRMPPRRKLIEPVPGPVRPPCSTESADCVPPAGRCIVRFADAVGRPRVATLSPARPAWGAGRARRAHSRFPGHALTPTGVMAIRCKQFHLPDL